MPQSSFFNVHERLGESFEKGQQLANQQIKTTAQTMAAQITGQTPAPTDAAGGKGQDQQTKDFVNELYGLSDQKPTAQQTQNGQNPQQAVAQTPDEAKKLAETRANLQYHLDHYYRPTFEAKPKQEEHQAEKVEREETEEKQKRWELQQEEAKKNEVPMAVRMATNRAEQFRGAAG